MGLFVYTQKGSIISMVDLPTTEIIEPIKYSLEVGENSLTFSSFFCKCTRFIQFFKKCV